MADKSSRGLVLYGDGLARFISPSHTHLHSLSTIASCGFLSLPHSPPSESEDGRIVREFAELLDAHEAYIKMTQGDDGKIDCQVEFLMPNMSERFMGIKAAIVTNNSSLISFGNKLGFTSLLLNKLIDNSYSHSASMLEGVTSELLKLIGFQEGKTLETSQFDLVFVHIGASENTNDQKNVEFVNDLVGEIMQKSQPGSEVGSRLHLSVVMNFGATTEDDDSNLSFLDSNNKYNCGFRSLMPCQSYTMKAGNPRKSVRHHSPMLIAQWQNAVTRKDMAEMFSFKDFKEHSGNLTIPADRFLHEVAFKLWKAPKYGA